MGTVIDVPYPIKCALVVDDDADVRENLEELLVREGFNVRGAASGEVALELLRASNEPCIVLLDLVMPTMDGWEVLDALMKMRSIAPHTHPVIVVSGALDAASAAKMPGVVAVLQKPFDLEDLLSAVREYAAPIGSSSVAR